MLRYELVSGCEQRRFGARFVSQEFYELTHGFLFVRGERLYKFGDTFGGDNFPKL
jgi:hypothetical protein